MRSAGASVRHRAHSTHSLSLSLSLLPFQCLRVAEAAQAQAQAEREREKRSGKVKLRNLFFSSFAFSTLEMHGTITITFYFLF